jgi:hypothetical protein
VIAVIRGDEMTHFSLPHCCLRGGGTEGHEILLLKVAADVGSSGKPKNVNSAE